MIVFQNQLRHFQNSLLSIHFQSHVSLTIGSSFGSREFCLMMQELGLTIGSSFGLEIIFVIHLQFLKIYNIDN